MAIQTRGFGLMHNRNKLNEAASSLNEAVVTKTVPKLGKVSIDRSEAKLLGVKDYEDALSKAAAFAKFVDNDPRFTVYKAVKVSGSTEAIDIARNGGRPEYEIYFENGALVYGGLFLEKSDVKHFEMYGTLPKQ